KLVEAEILDQRFGDRAVRSPATRGVIAANHEVELVRGEALPSAGAVGEGLVEAAGWVGVVGAGPTLTHVEELLRVADSFASPAELLARDIRASRDAVKPGGLF